MGYATPVGKLAVLPIREENGQNQTNCATCHVTHVNSMKSNHHTIFHVDSLCRNFVACL